VPRPTTPTLAITGVRSGDEPGEDLVVLGEAADLLLREDELAVDEDVELAVPARRDGRGRVPRTLDLGGETRRP
jgi:hypothetical protein